jgi:hypothetical protein
LHPENVVPFGVRGAASAAVAYVILWLREGHSALVLDRAYQPVGWMVEVDALRFLYTHADLIVQREKTYPHAGYTWRDAAWLQVENQQCPHCFAVMTYGTPPRCCRCGRFATKVRHLQNEQIPRF